MAGSKSTAAPALPIPRFVHNLNAMAKKCGLAVDAGVRDPNPSESWDNQGRPRLVVIWSGTTKQLRETGFFPKSYHFPTGDRGQFRFSLWRRGRMLKEGRCWRIEVDCSECPSHIEQQGAIEVIHYEEETAFHGTHDALISAKVCAVKHLPLKRANKCWYSGRRCYTHKFHDGTYLFTLENEEVFKKRQEDERQEDAHVALILGRARQQPSSQGREREPTTAEEYREHLETAARMATTLLTEITKDSLRRYRYYLSPPDVERLQRKLDEATSIIQTAAIRERQEPASANDHTRAMLANAEADPRFQRFLGRLTQGQRPAA